MDVIIFEVPLFFGKKHLIPYQNIQYSVEQKK